MYMSLINDKKPEDINDNTNCANWDPTPKLDDFIKKSAQGREDEIRRFLDKANDKAKKLFVNYASDKMNDLFAKYGNNLSNDLLKKAAGRFTTINPGKSGSILMTLSKPMLALIYKQVRKFLDKEAHDNGVTLESIITGAGKTTAELTCNIYKYSKHMTNKWQDEFHANFDSYLAFLNDKTNDGINRANDIAYTLYNNVSKEVKDIFEKHTALKTVWDKFDKAQLFLYHKIINKQQPFKDVLLLYGYYYWGAPYDNKDGLTNVEDFIKLEGKKQKQAEAFKKVNSKVGKSHLIWKVKKMVEWALKKVSSETLKEYLGVHKYNSQTAIMAEFEDLHNNKKLPDDISKYYHHLTGSSS